MGSVVSDGFKCGKGSGKGSVRNGTGLSHFPIGGAVRDFDVVMARRGEHREGLRSSLYRPRLVPKGPHIKDPSRHHLDEEAHVGVLLARLARQSPERLVDGGRKVERLLVGEPELACEFVDADIGWHVLAKVLGDVRTAGTLPRRSWR